MNAADWLHRLLVGDTSWLFLVEVIYRAAVVYVFLLVAMRTMGKRMAAQLGIAELAVVLMLGAAISAPIQMPTQGILPALVVLATISALHRGLAWWSYRSAKVELRVHGDAMVLVEDGRFSLECLHKTRISRAMLISELRTRGIRTLGEIRRLYLEPAGGFSLIRYRDPVPGLSLAPSEDQAVWQTRRAEGRYVCAWCGLRWKGSPCRYCGHEHAAGGFLPH